MNMDFSDVDSDDIEISWIRWNSKWNSSIFSKEEGKERFINDMLNYEVIVSHKDVSN